MEPWKGTSEEFLIKMGWKKIKGFKVDMCFLEPYDHLDSVYFESTEDFIEPCEYWISSDAVTEYASEDADDIIENRYPEYFDDQDNLYDEPINMIK